MSTIIHKLRALLKLLFPARSAVEYNPFAGIEQEVSMSGNYDVFGKVFDRVIAHEGGYVNHPDDPGGETNWGITKRVAREWGYEGDMKELSRSTARDIYYELYWKRAKCDQYHPAIGFQLFDAAVNHGIGNAIRMLQRAVGTVDDGLIGPITLGLIEETDDYEILTKFNAERIDFYARLRTFDSFGRGWVRRVSSNMRHSVEDLKYEA